MRRFSAPSMALLTAVLLASASHAQDNRYGTWNNPDTNAAAGTAGADARLKDFTDRLNKLIDDAEKAKAADPVFLQDLRALANGTAVTTGKVLLNDTFADGDFSQNPTWQVLSGGYFVEKNWGLRNRILQTQNTANSGSGGNEDLAKVLLGTILKKATGTEGSAQATDNAIATRFAVPNAFALSLDLFAAAPGHFEVGVFQGDAAKNGYRLLYESGKGLQLHRIGSSGTAVVQTSAKALTLEDKKFHAIEWTRSASGTMSVRVDGTEVLNVTDRGFSDPFAGIRFSDSGGDFIVKRVTVRG